MLRLMTLLALSCIALIATAAPAGDSGVWQHPLIQSAGKMHFLPDAVFMPDPAATYKAVFDVTTAASDPKQAVEGLDDVARTVNLFAAAKVPMDHLKLVVLLRGGALSAILTDAQYRKQYDTDNPNRKIIHELKGVGVQFVACGQAVTGRKYEAGWIDPDVQVALSGLTTLILLQNQGYAVM